MASSVDIYMERRRTGQLNQPAPQKPKRSLGMTLLPAGAAIGAGLIAAPFTGGLSLAGTIAALGAAGAIGGGLGEYGAQRFSNEKEDWGKIGKEAAISGLFGAGGAALSGAKGLKAAHAAGLAGGAFGKGAASVTAGKVASGALRSKDIGRLVKAGLITNADDSLKVVHAAFKAAPKAISQKAATKEIGKATLAGDPVKAYNIWKNLPPGHVKNHFKDSFKNFPELIEGKGLEQIVPGGKIVNQAARTAKTVKPPKLAETLVQSVDDVSKVEAEIAKSAKARGIGAFNPKEGLRAIPNAAERTATATKYGIKSGRKGLEQATKQLNKLETELSPLLANTKIPVKDVYKSIDDAAFSTLSPTAETPALVKNLKRVVQNNAKGGVITGDKLRNIRSEIGQVFGKNSTSPLAGLQKDIYGSLGKTIGSKAEKAKALITEQGKILDLAPGLSARSADVAVPLPFVGGRVKIPGAASVRDFVINRAADGLPPVGREAIKGAQRQAGALYLSSAGQNEGPPITNALQNQGMVSGYQGVNQNYQTNPDGSYSPTYPSNTTDTFTMSQAQRQGNGLAGAIAPQPPQIESPYPLANAMADIQRDPKNAKQYMAYYDFVNQAIQAQQEESGLTADQKNKQAKAQSLQQGVGVLLNNYQAAGAGQGIVGGGRSILGRTPGVRSLGLDPQAQNFEDQRKALIAPLARTISGEVGVLTDRDISRAEGLLPRLSDPPEVAQKKIEDLLYLIQNAGGGGSELESELANAGYSQGGGY